MNDKIICRVLTGPTASGKTEIGVRLAREQGWDIICMDSMQIYRHMDIGTAKPTQEEMQGVPHHMMDICDPRDPYSVSEYCSTAVKLLKDLHSEGRTALFVGGTTLYLKCMMHPASMGQAPANESLRAELNEQAMTLNGRIALHERLSHIDPVTADRLPVNDVRRIIRAIEVYEATGVPFSAQSSISPENDDHFSWIVASTRMDRKTLYERINHRVTDMIRNGLRDEVSSLLKEGVPETSQSLSAIGYKEMIPCVRGLPS